MFKTLIDRPYTPGQSNLEKMITELSPHMREDEVDKCVDILIMLEKSTIDDNPSVTDARTRLELLLGRDRFLEITKAWNKKNQKFLSVFGKLKYKHKITGQLFDGLDPEDNPDDYEKTYV